VLGGGDNRSPLGPSGFFILRTPLLPFRELLDWADGAERDRGLLRARLREIVDRPEVREAIFVSSPLLEELIDVWKAEPDSERGRQCEPALVRFLARMCGRPTPFGLFAGVSLGTVGGETRLTLEGFETSRRRTRLDSSYLVEVVEGQLAAPEQREVTDYRPNPSLYRVGNRYRYIRSRPGAEEQRHELASIPESPALATVIAAAAKGAPPARLAEAVAGARDVVDDLIERQVLVPSLALQLTGADSTYGLADAVPALHAARRDLEAIDAEGLGVSPWRYRSVATELDTLTGKPRLEFLFQVDLVKRSPGAMLGDEVVREILRGIELRSRIDRPDEDAVLQEFVERFEARFEGRAVPLLEALDPDVGVGLDEELEFEPFAAELPSSPPAPAATWGQREEHLLSRVLALQAESKDELVLDAHDLAGLENADAAPLPDACAAQAVVAAASEAELASGRFRVLVGAASGPSGARWLGRFCHADDDLRAAVEGHLKAEEALEPDAVFAEIVHLPWIRDGNLVARPVLRSWELPCLDRSGVPPEQQVSLDDLLVSVADDRVSLWSRRLGRRVVPRLTSAHDFEKRGAPVYRFLCRLQGQGRSGEGSFWGPLASAPWLPRVRSGRVVLERARWRLASDELRDIEALQEWRRSRRVPRLVSLVGPWFELPTDLDNVLAVEALVQVLRRRGEVELVELFPPPDELCVHGPEGSYVHEVVVPFVRAEATEPAPQPPSQVLVRRTFPPGSGWLYARIFTGEATADDVLLSDVAPLVREQLAAGAADSWFFLRYGAPAYHLRVRLHGDPGRLQAAVETAGASALERGLAWCIELGTYEREVERYGGPEAIELAERIFRADSDAVLALLPLVEPDERWRTGLVGVHRLLLDLGFDLDGRLGIVRARAEAIARMRGWEKAVRGRIGSRFRRERTSLERLLEAPPPEALAERSRSLELPGRQLTRLELDGRLTMPLTAVSTSLLHMHLNRLLRGDNTGQEGVICDFLARLYQAESRRQSSG